MARVHATAVVEAGAALADDVEVGAFALIGAQVRIGLDGDVREVTLRNNRHAVPPCGPSCTDRLPGPAGN